MRIKNPFKHLEPEYGDTMVEMMQGAFWMMFAFMFGSWFLRSLIELVLVNNLVCGVK